MAIWVLPFNTQLSEAPVSTLLESSRNLLWKLGHVARFFTATGGLFHQPLGESAVFWYTIYYGFKGYKWPHYISTLKHSSYNMQLCTNAESVILCNIRWQHYYNILFGHSEVQVYDTSVLRGHSSGSSWLYVCKHCLCLFVLHTGVQHVSTLVSISIDNELSMEIVCHRLGTGNYVLSKCK